MKTNTRGTAPTISQATRTRGTAKAAQAALTITGDLAAEIRALASQQGAKPAAIVKEHLRLGLLATEPSEKGQQFRREIAGGAAKAEPTHAELIRRSTTPAPVAGKPVAVAFEVRTPWTKIRFKMLADLAAELRALPPIPFENLGKDVYMHLWPATLELEKGTDWKAGSATRRIEQEANDWVRCIKGRRLAEMEVTMPAREWKAIQSLAARLEVPADALILAGLWERLRKLRRAYEARGETLGARPAAASPSVAGPFPGWLMLNLSIKDADAWAEAALRRKMIPKDFGAEAVENAVTSPSGARLPIRKMPVLAGGAWQGDTRLVPIDPTLWPAVVKLAGEIGITPHDWAHSVILAAATATGKGGRP